MGGVYQANLLTDNLHGDELKISVSLPANALDIHYWSKCWDYSGMSNQYLSMYLY